jgi:hypothetical protein
MQIDAQTRFKLAKKNTRDIMDENLEDHMLGRITIKRNVHEYSSDAYDPN